MDDAPSNSEIAADEDTENRYLKRDDTLDPQKPSLARHNLSDANSNSADDNKGEIEVGHLYEIDHSELPPKSPIHFKTIRVAMVTEKTKLNVSVRFPSNLSLRKYFSGEPGRETRRNVARIMHPVLDEQFIMGVNLASKVLRRRVPSSEFAQHKHLECFWVVPPNENPIKVEYPVGVCRSGLRCAALVSWGTRRKVRFLGRHRETPPLAIKGECISRDSIGEKRKPKRENGISETSKKKKRSIHEKEKNSFPCSKDRWPRERYAMAEMKLLDILRAKGAVLGNSILRPALRAEARNHIGDTGLLDHLLKHMAGKVVRGERLGRRHNPDGAMEYWLEPAEFVDLRRQAGVKDPYWAPPPGWKPGDSIESESLMAVKQLKEEMAPMKRDLELLLSWMHESEANASLSSTKDIQLETSPTSSLEESYERLVKRKSLLEEQLNEISKSLNGMREEMRQLSSSNKVVEEAKEKEAKKNRLRSSFRICKPQGTFLWPNSGGIIMPNEQQVQVEDLLGPVPTPPSTSSATLAPRLPPATSPVGRVVTLLVPPTSSPKPGPAAEGPTPLLPTTTTCLTLSAGVKEVVVDEFGRLDGGGGSNSSSTIADLTQRDSSAGAWLALATPTPLLPTIPSMLF
ncbi:protein AMEIOTIC 1-like [Tasmannia lanceolata]|uniref:protein AMEIOTIC 1-like n=1 Tax=Tasmannia lanceolata TaxID=3420 RepID=UPI0040633DDD